MINDNAAPRQPGQSSSSYKSLLIAPRHSGPTSGDSYSASYGPWIIIPHPARVGTTVTVPPGGAVMGMMARSTPPSACSVPRPVSSPASPTLWACRPSSPTPSWATSTPSNINVIRSVVGAGICVHGCPYPQDLRRRPLRVSARRTLIYIKESMRRSTQFAVFENNDQRLWSLAADDRRPHPASPVGAPVVCGEPTAAEAYFIRCDDTHQHAAVIQSGEVRMEVGVALEYPAEFVVIRDHAVRPAARSHRSPAHRLKEVSHHGSPDHFGTDPTPGRPGPELQVPGAVVPRRRRPCPERVRGRWGSCRSRASP